MSQAESTAVHLSAQVPAAIQEQLRTIGPVVAPAATAALYAPLHPAEPYPFARVLRDRAYGPDDRHRLDVFQPRDGALARPVLVFVHGGGFVGGSKRSGDAPFYDNVMLWAVRNGFVGVNTTYRLAPAHPWPAAQQDLHAALAWIGDNMAAHGGDPARIVLVGHSAGAAHVAQYLGHPQFQAQRAGAPSWTVAAAVFLSGLFDPSKCERNAPLRAYFGADETVYAERSALPGLAQGGVPLMFAYAQFDPPDFQRQSHQAYDATCAGAGGARLFELRGHSHMSEVFAIGTPDTALTAELARFIEQESIH